MGLQPLPQQSSYIQGWGHLAGPDVTQWAGPEGLRSALDLQCLLAPPSSLLTRAPTHLAPQGHNGVLELTGGGRFRSPIWKESHKAQELSQKPQAEQHHSKLPPLTLQEDQGAKDLVLSQIFLKVLSQGFLKKIQICYKVSLENTPALLGQNPFDFPVLLSNLPVHIRFPIFITGLRLRQNKAIELPDLQTQTIHEMLIKLEARKGSKKEKKWHEQA